MNLKYLNSKIRKLRKMLFSITVGLIPLSSMSVASIATDSPTNYTTETWTNGANMGSGFTPWEFSHTAQEATPTSEIFNVYVENWNPEASWNVMSTTNGTSSAFRGFKTLEIGEQVYVRFKIDSVTDNASRVGVRLYQNTNLLYFIQYEDENNSWNMNNTMSWTGVDPINTTEFIWGRSAQSEIDVQMRYEGTNKVSVFGYSWTNGSPDRIEIFSEYQGTDTGGIGVIEINAPAIPEPTTLAMLIIAGLSSFWVSRSLRKRKS